MTFFPETPPGPAQADEPDEPTRPAWMGAPDDVLPGVAPVELIIGRSTSTVVMLTGMRCFPTGVEMELRVRVRGQVRRRELHGEIFDGPFAHDMDDDWRAGRLKWGFELADGTRATNVDPWPTTSDAAGPASFATAPEPAGPVLHGDGGGGGPRSVQRRYWLWPLPPPGRLRVACQWLDQGIDLTVQDLTTEPFLEAASRARPVWGDA